MCHSTICTILALAAIEDLELQSVDISHAFTNSDIDTEIYMAQPEGFVQGGSKYVCTSCSHSKETRSIILKTRRSEDGNN